MPWKHAPTEFDEEIKKLGQEAMALLRDSQLIDSSLRSMPKIEANKPARNSLQAQKESLLRQRTAVLSRQRNLANEREQQRRLAMIGDSPTLASGIREYARRVGYLEQFYFNVVENLDDPEFDIRLAVAKLKKMLGDDPAEEQQA